MVNSCVKHPVPLSLWAEYLRVREDINLKIMEILEEENVSIAFPSRSVYIETEKKEEPVETA